MIAIDYHHDDCITDQPLLLAHASIYYVLSPPYSQRLGILLRFHSRQAHDTIHHVLESLLVLRGRVSRCLSALDFLSIIPLNLERRQDDTRVEAVDVLVGVCGQAF